MVTEKEAKDVAEALVRNQIYALNLKAKPVPRFYRFKELEFFEPYKRKAIVDESSSFAIRQWVFIYASLATITTVLLVFYFLWHISPKSHFNYYLFFLMAPVISPLHYLKRKIMLSYIRSKIESISAASSDV